jgi:hypothetical protein
MVTAALALFPCALAVIVVEPTATDVTTPVDETVAIAALAVLQLKVTPEMGVPLASYAVAASVALWPNVMDTDAGATDTLATDGGGAATTVTVVLPLFPCADAVTVVVPKATAVTTPVGETVATAGFALAQRKTTPGTGLPFASYAAAVSAAV